jgi:hypothetical protein
LCSQKVLYDELRLGAKFQAKGRTGGCIMMTTVLGGEGRLYVYIPAHLRVSRLLKWVLYTFVVLYIRS